MGLFSFFQKSPENIEEAADRCFNDGDYGSAKIEYDRALSRAEKNSPENIALIRRLGDKCRKAREALAGSHLETARELLMTGEHDEEAYELVSLALDLTEDETLTRNLLALRGDTAGGGASNRDLTQSADAVTGDAGGPIIEDHEDGNEDDYFFILCSTLPDEIQDAYHAFSPAFREGFVALNSGDFETAAARLEDAINENDDPDGLIPSELATALVNLGRYETARQLMEPFIQHHLESIRGYQILCDIYWEQKAYDRALSLLGSCPAKLQSSLQIQLLISETLYLRGDFKSAIRLLSTWRNDYGYNEIMARSLAKTLEAAGEIHAARDLYAQIIKGCASCGSRTDPFIRRRYAELCFQAGDQPKKLLDLFLSLSQEDPDNKKEYYYRIQQLYDKMGDAAESRRFLEMAESLDARGKVKDYDRGN
jgi:tetratricopeptide (TPR) repeat protein